MTLKPFCYLSTMIFLRNKECKIITLISKISLTTVRRFRHFLLIRHSILRRNKNVTNSAWWHLTMATSSFSLCSLLKHLTRIVRLTFFYFFPPLSWFVSWKIKIFAPGNDATTYFIWELSSWCFRLQCTFSFDKFLTVHITL